LYEYITSTGIAGKAFLDRLRLLVERYGRGSKAGTRSGGDEVGGLVEGTDDIQGKDESHARGGNEKKISMELLEEIRSRGCFIHPESVTPLVLPPDTTTLCLAYSHTSDPNTRSTVFVDENSERGSRSDAGRSHSSTRWVIPGWVRERTGEVFFELGEGDEGCSLQEVLAGCLVKVSSSSVVLVVFVVHHRDRDHPLRGRRS
jgi:hypothetical protein